MEKVPSAGGKRPFQDERERRCLGGLGMMIRAEELGLKVSEGSPDRPGPSTGSLALQRPHQGRVGAFAVLA